MTAYYRKRAPVYERVYAYPERQADLCKLEKIVLDRFAGRRVIEVGAGTGYWTRRIAHTANFILATDLAPEPLALIDTESGDANIQTDIQDAFDLSPGDESFDAGFAGLFISHVPVQERNRFFRGLHDCLGTDAEVMLIDNSKSQLHRIPLVETDQYGNTYQERILDDGSTYRVLKNFPSKDELLEDAGVRGTDAEYLSLDHFWMLRYRPG